jgi:CRP/FNR family transcriptional regulator
VRGYRAGQGISTGARRAILHLVLEGRISTYDLRPNGRRIILDQVEAGGVDGFLTVAGLRGHFSEAAVDSQVVPIDSGQLERMIEAEPQVAVRLMWMMTRRLQRREDQVQDMVIRDPGQRLAARLLALADGAGLEPGGHAVIPRVSHEKLADMLGLRRETVTQHLSRLRSRGAVRVERDTFELDVELLESIRDRDD